MNTQPEPVAVIDGNPVATLPKSLYVPPAALRVFLVSFEGPLDFLHYLIRRNDMDIRNIRMTEITEQYLAYVNEVVDTQIELAADYLLMSATLIEIKSRMLLPVPESDDELAEDPRVELAERLLLYNKYRLAAEDLRDREYLGRDMWPPQVEVSTDYVGSPSINARNLQLAMLGVLAHKEMEADLSMATDAYSLRDAMAHLFVRMRSSGSWLFSQLLGKQHASRARVGVFFQAVLQMAKEQLVHVKQHEDEVQVTPRMGKSSRK